MCLELSGHNAPYYIFGFESYRNRHWGRRLDETTMASALTLPIALCPFFMILLKMFHHSRWYPHQLSIKSIYSLHQIMDFFFFFFERGRKVPEPSIWNEWQMIKQSWKLQWKRGQWFSLYIYIYYSYPKRLKMPLLDHIHRIWIHGGLLDFLHKQNDMDLNLY